MSVFDLLDQSRPLLLVCSALLGLVVGSFLNVVILRLPVMLERAWRRDCRAFLELPEEEAAAPFNLIVPRSHCPSCGHQITASENIPVVSYLVLGGRCSSCRNPIAIRYPLIEAITAAVSVLIALQFGASGQTAAALLLGWSLICLTMIDADRQILPDAITLPLLWLGLVFNSQGLFVTAESAIVGAVAGYGILWLVYHGFRLATGKEGMGYGDFKLLAALGAWLGWQALPTIVILSSAVGAAFGISMIISGKLERSNPIPFGPYLAVAGLIALLWGDQIVQTYLEFAGLNR
ncbi:MAG: prepilin peptidase [Methylococcaceae bacterium]|nr:prepilin peptidase [Methylococcaceae bacterium]